MKKLKFIITTNAYQQIVKTLGSKIPEQGGILIGKDGVITDFIHDEFAETSSSTYSLNISYLNPIIKKFKEEELNELIRLAYFSYQANTPSAELIRHAPALYSNLSNKYILEYRREVSKEALSIIDKAKAIDDSWISLLSEEDLQNIKNISERIVTGRGSTPKDELTKEEK